MQAKPFIAPEFHAFLPLSPPAPWKIGWEKNEETIYINVRS